MEPNEKFLKLLSSLRDATAKGRVEWSDTADEDTFQTILDRAVVQISKVYDEVYKKTEIVATLADPKGKRLASVATVDLDAPSSLSILNDLYDLARGRVNKVDELLDHLIADVESRRK